MGTHPIFESDFDCLTECSARKKKSTKDCQNTSAGLIHFQLGFSLKLNKSNKRIQKINGTNSPISSKKKLLIDTLYPKMSGECIEKIAGHTLHHHQNEQLRASIHNVK